MARGHSKKLGQLRCVWVEPGGGNLSVACNFFKYLLVVHLFFLFVYFVLFCFFFLTFFRLLCGTPSVPYKKLNSNKPVFKRVRPLIDSLCLVLTLELLQNLKFHLYHIHTHTSHPHSHLCTALFLDFIVDVPDVSLQGVGTALQVPGGQGQLGVELLHVGGLGDGFQRVGATAQQEVTEGRLDGGDVRRKERVLDLESCRKTKKAVMHLRDVGKN